MIPAELNIADIYFQPIAVVGAISILLTWVTALVLNRYRLSRFFAAPSVVFLAICALYGVTIGTFIIPV